MMTESLFLVELYTFKFILLCSSSTGRQILENNGGRFRNVIFKNTSPPSGKQNIYFTKAKEKRGFLVHVDEASKRFEIIIKQMDKTVLRIKPKLVNWLSGDPYGILQHVQSLEIITDSEYDMLKSISVPQKQVIELLDIILKKGEKVCGDFLQMLSEDDVNEFSPQLREWIKTVKISDTTDNALVKHTTSSGRVTSHITASGGGTTVFAPTLGFNSGTINMNIQTGQKNEEGASCNMPRDCEEFLKKKRSLLIQRVKHIDLIVDDLALHSESDGNIRSQATDQNKMRKLLDYINSKTIAERLVDALFKYEFDLMNDLCS